MTHELIAQSRYDALMEKNQTLLDSDEPKIVEIGAGVLKAVALGLLRGHYVVVKDDDPRLAGTDGLVEVE